MKKTLGLILVLLATFTLVACGGGADKKFVQEALDLATSFSGNPETEGITRDQSFPTKLRDYEGVELTWESDKPDYLANDGKITRPEPGKADEMVTVKVTAAKGKTKDSKTVKFLVIANVKGDEVTLSELYDTKEDISSAQDGSKFSYEYLGEIVEIDALTVVAKYANNTGMYLTDGVRLLFIYGKSHVESVQVGKVYDVKGVFGHNYGSAQLSDVKDGVAVTITENTTAAVTKAPLTKATLNENFIDNVVYSADFLFEPNAYELTARVIIDSADDSASYHTFLVAPEYDDYKIVKSVSGGKATTFEGPVVNVYYAGLVDEVKAFNGRTITVPYFPVGVRTDRGGLNYGVILDDKSIDVKPITELEEMKNMVNLVKAGFLGKEFNDTLEDEQLPVFTEKTLEKGKANFVWTSNKPLVVDNTGKILLRTIDNDVKFTVVITYGELTETVEVDFKILKETVLVPITIAAALEKAKDAEVIVEGSIAKYQDKNFVVQDATGSITVRDNNNLLKDLDWTKNYILVGTISEHNGVKQIALTRVEASESTHTVSNLTVTKDTVLKDLEIEFILVEGVITEVDFEERYASVSFKLGELVIKVSLDTNVEDTMVAAQVANFKNIKVGDVVKMENVLVLSGTYVNIYFNTRTLITVV